MLRTLLAALSCLISCSPSLTAQTSYVLKPARVFDGSDTHEGWIVVVQGEKISAAGPADKIQTPKGARIIEMAGMTLLPGLIDVHSHLLLHPYSETTWDDQVLKEPQALRVCRAVNHARDTLQAGFTTLRDLGTEGAGYADVGLKQAIDQGIIPGPRLLVTTRAIVATGSYGPKGFAPEWRIPLGAEEADGDSLIRVTRDQIGKGADWIKVYADAWNPTKGGSPSFSLEELKTIVEVAKAQNCPVVAHAMTKEGIRRAALAGVATIEHGDDGDVEVFRLMANRGVALCPTLAASEAMSRYRGWQAGTPEPTALRNRRAMFKQALESGVTIVNGSDVGVFPHGTEARELELMVEYGMSQTQALRAATTVAAKVLHLEKLIGSIKPGQMADLVAVDGNPLKHIATLRQVRWVFKSGKPARQASNP